MIGFGVEQLDLFRAGGTFVVSRGQPLAASPGVIRRARHVPSSAADANVRLRSPVVGSVATPGQQAARTSNFQPGGRAQTGDLQYTVTPPANVRLDR
jgi:hypothetical protein